MTYFTILDTNILVSALLNDESEGPINQIMDYIYRRKIVPVYSDEIYKEYKEVLNRSKFNFESHKIGLTLNMIKKYGLSIKPMRGIEKTFDQKDQDFYDAVITKRKDSDAYLVTGNLKHFPLKDFIVNAREMINIILNRKEYA